MTSYIHAGKLLCANEDQVDFIDNAVIGMEEDKISTIELLDTWEKKKEKDFIWIDASKFLVTPGLVDCHTHLLFDGSRSGEFFDRLSGRTYEEISREGGGIYRTVEATHHATDEILLSRATRRLNKFLACGVTTVEVKSGYGLSFEDEIRLLQVLQKLKHPVDIVPTCLGAHLVPKSYQKNRDKFLAMVCNELLPFVKKNKLSRICDVFCDNEAFTVEEARKILNAAKSLGFACKLHADQLSYSGGAELASELGCLSADHLDFVSFEAMSKMALANVVGVMIPSAHIFLGKKQVAPARDLRRAGVKLAVSTDCNPGTSHTANLPLAMTLAATELKMTCDEIWLGVTRYASKALGLLNCGVIEQGKNADFCVWDTLDYRDIPYQFGSAQPIQVIKNGKIVHIVN